MADPDDSNWLETEALAAAAVVQAAEEDWLEVQDPNAGKTTREFEHMINACMRGTNRVMACDGQFLAYRPFNREFDKEVNPRTRERFADFAAAGHYEHIGTFDEVQIYRLLDGSPFKHVKKSYVIGMNIREDIKQAAKAACDRNWADYHDILGAVATGIKSGRDPLFAKAMWDDTLGHIAVMIKQMGGPAAPTEKEVNEGFTGIRKARGISKGGVVATLDSSRLQQVRMK